MPARPHARRGRAFSALLLLSVAASPARADDAARIARWHARADALAARGRTVQAGALWLRVLDRAPTDRRALDGLAAAVLPDVAGAMPETAPDPRRLGILIERLERALGSSPAAEDRVPLERLRACAIAWRDGPRAALDAILPRLGAYDPDGAAWLARIATISILRGDLDTAALALTAAVRADGTNERLRSDAALVAIARGQADEAIATLRVRDAEAPPPSDPARVVGALLAAGDSDEAVRRARAHAASVDDGERWTWLAAVALEAGRPAVAEDAARRAAVSVPADDGRPFRLRGLALVALGRVDEARTAFLEALRRSPNDVATRAALEAIRR